MASAAFLAAALLPMPLAFSVIDAVVFGSFLVLLVANPLSRRVAFRVDAEGVTLGGVFPRPRRSTAFIPWRDVIGLQLFELPFGRPHAPYIHVIRRAEAPTLPTGMGFGRLNQRMVGPEFAASRPIVAWTLDPERLRAVLAGVAPNVHISGTLPGRESGTASRRPRTSGAPKLRLLWRFVAPIVFVTLVCLGTLHLGPAWSAHLGHGRIGTWTVTQIDCGSKGGCTALGTFDSADGSDVRQSIRIALGAPPVSGVGSRLPAIDTGDSDHIYPLGGGPSWWIFALLTVIPIPLLALWIWTVPVAIFTRRRPPTPGL
jgi:hypothetical protein